MSWQPYLDECSIAEFLVCACVNRLVVKDWTNRLDTTIIDAAIASRIGLSKDTLTRSHDRPI